MVCNMHLDITILTSEPADVSSNTRTTSAAASASLSRTAGSHVLQIIPSVLLLSSRNHDLGAATRTTERFYISMASSLKSMPSRPRVNGPLVMLATCFARTLGTGMFRRRSRELHLRRYVDWRALSIFAKYSRDASGMECSMGLFTICVVV